VKKLGKALVLSTEYSLKTINYIYDAIEQKLFKTRPYGYSQRPFRGLWIISLVAILLTSSISIQATEINMSSIHVKQTTINITASLGMLVKTVNNGIVSVGATLCVGTLESL